MDGVDENERAARNPAKDRRTALMVHPEGLRRIGAWKDARKMASPLSYTVPETEPTPRELAQWQAELERDMRAADRGPVGVTVGVYGLPFVVCKDGTVWQMQSQPAGPEVSDGRLYVWEQLPAIPGSTGDLNHSYWNEPA